MLCLQYIYISNKICASTTLFSLATYAGFGLMQKHHYFFIFDNRFKSSTHQKKNSEILPSRVANEMQAVQDRLNKKQLKLNNEKWKSSLAFNTVLASISTCDFKVINCHIHRTRFEMQTCNNDQSNIIFLLSSKTIFRAYAI